LILATLISAVTLVVQITSKLVWSANQLESPLKSAELQFGIRQAL
jgi:hypothetical protein